MTKSMLGMLIMASSLLAGCGGPTPHQQAVPIGGGCDGCELMYINLPQQIAAVDTSPAWQGKGQKLKISGRVFTAGGVRPAPGIIIYYWQTDHEGYYASREGLDARAKRHGYIRGWLKTDAEGRYTLYTIRPAPYPNDSQPAHIHLSVKEPDLPNEYYTDEIHFNDDPFLKTYLKTHTPENRGGSGIVRILKQDGLQVAEHNITLGLNIPGYPGS